MAGLPGSGKTTLARALASLLGGVVVSKDEVRAALFPPELIDFSSEQDDLCMHAVIEAAKYLTRKRRTSFVFFDGRTFSRTHQVEQVTRAAEECGAQWKILHLHVLDELARVRLESDPGHLAGNRDFSLYQRVKSEFEPITHPKLDIDTSRPLEECLAACEKYLRPG